MYHTERGQNVILFLDFVRCQRADGTFYGTSGKCRKGREVDAKKILDKLTKGFSETKKDVFDSAINPKGGLIGKGKDLGNGVSAVKGDLQVLEKLGKLPGLPKPVAKVVGEPNVAIVARKTIVPWNRVEIPEAAMRPYLRNNPSKGWLETFSDPDMAVNPTLLTANSLLKPAYNRYNKEFFDGKLPDINLYISPALASAYAIAQPANSTHNKSPFIALAWRYMQSATEEAMHGILLHEMVHIHDFINNRVDENHGKIFTAKLNAIDKAWKRDSKDIYVDSIMGSVGGYQYSRARMNKTKSDRLYPNIKNDETLKSKAVEGFNYRFLKWK